MSLTEVMNDLGVKVSFEFIPSKRGTLAHNLRFTWLARVTQYDHDVIELEYYKTATEYYPKYKGTIEEYWADARKACETGICPVTVLPIKEPSQEEVMESLLHDSSPIHYESFEDWAVNSGVSDDSIYNKNQYDRGLKIALRLNRRLGAYGFNELLVSLQEEKEDEL